MSSTTKPTSSEDIIGQKYDRCLADFLVKAGVGFSAGVVASVILFKRRTWPIALSTGFGAGAAYADCDRSFNPARIPGVRVIPASETTSPKASQ
ncbi:Mitochondrial inner membrane organizing system component [Paramarasmius palmivorus]|uniref:MICOS complex subunit MIC10 n=1 Tax=Paramarasmius palmivorus TaxID=297713 RepID=A0AAW0CEG4_9AGAR